MAESKPKMKKVAIKTVLADCRADMNDAKQCRGLLATFFDKAQKEWIPTIGKVEKEAKTLYKKALDLSIDATEDGMMDVEVSSDEGEQVNVQDNTNTQSVPEAGDNGAPVDTGAPTDNGVPPAGNDMSNEDITKTFRAIAGDLTKLANAFEKKNKVKK